MAVMAGSSATDEIRAVADQLRAIVGQITPEEFRWQEGNYDRDSPLGRELLFLIANNEWARATAETIDITRSDAVETMIKIDTDLDRITHEAFRHRTGRLWLPVVVLPPLRQRLPEPDPFVTLTVTDAGGNLLATLPSADVRHRISAALAEIIVNMAVARWPGMRGDGPTATRDQRLLLSAAIYRLLRSERVGRATGSRAAWRPASACRLWRGRSGGIVIALTAPLSWSSDRGPGGRCPGSGGTAAHRRQRRRRDTRCT
jgi:hypothetical protein